MKAYALGLYEKAMPDTLSWREKLLAAKAAGYDYIELSIDASEEKISRIYMDRAARLELISLVYETGMPIRSMCVSALTKYSLGNPKPEYRARGMEIAEKSIELAEDLGIRIVMIPGYDVYYEPSSFETKQDFMENIQRIAEIAAQRGVLVGFETMENEFMNTVGKAMKYVTLSKSNYLKVYPDIGNMTNAARLYQDDVLLDLRLGAGNLVAMHLKETQPGHFREVPYGTGHVEFEPAIRTAWELGVRCFVTEFWYKGSPHWQEDLQKTQASFAAILDRMEKHRECLRT